jgi:serine/threonine-protein kinase
VIAISVLLSVIIAAVFLARRNLRQGRSDTKSAFKISIFVFLVALAGNLLFADHIPDLTKEIPLLFKMAGYSLLGAVTIGLIYLALEPYVRQRWPSLIISWNRLLVGDWRDPLVGRDILVGGMLGLGHTAVIYVTTLLPIWTGGGAVPNSGLNISYLESVRHLWATFLLNLPFAVFVSFFFLLLLVLLVIVFKKQWMAATVFWILLFSVIGLAFGTGAQWADFLGAALSAAITVVVLARFGLLAMISRAVFFDLSLHNAITSDFSSWYFGNTIFAAVVLFGLAIYGFYTSLAGQPLLKSKLLED